VESLTPAHLRPGQALFGPSSLGRWSAPDEGVWSPATMDLGMPRSRATTHSTSPARRARVGIDPLRSSPTLVVAFSTSRPPQAEHQRRRVVILAVSGVRACNSRRHNAIRGVRHSRQSYRKALCTLEELCSVPATLGRDLGPWSPGTVLVMISAWRSPLNFQIPTALNHWCCQPGKTCSLSCSGPLRTCCDWNGSRKRAEALSWASSKRLGPSMSPWSS